MANRKKVGILYICTGPYSLFWEDFYDSFSENFLNDSELHFFIFSDKDIDFKDKKNIHFEKIPNLPWPLITLLRFHFFLSIEACISEMDYLVFFNANLTCTEKVIEEDFLPNSDEKLSFCSHPGYYNKKNIFVPCERNKKSKAFVPYKNKVNYVIGAVIAGESKNFIEMSRILKDNVDCDLKKNIIARWHDESHLNHFLCTLKDFKLLHPGYCYPVGFDIPFERKISAVSKQDKFDVKTFKGFDEKRTNLQKLKNFLASRIVPYLMLIKSYALFERIK